MEILFLHDKVNDQRQKHRLIIDEIGEISGVFEGIQMEQGDFCNAEAGGDD